MIKQKKPNIRAQIAKEKADQTDFMESLYF